MLRPRIIPCLLVKDGGLYKTTEFANYKYLGDPINTVRIFNELAADELIVFDIDATVKGAVPNYELISSLAAECSMPLCYGGGVSKVEQVLRIVDMGVEKVAISHAAVTNPKIITEMSRAVGSQSIVAVLDIRKNKSCNKGTYQIFTHNGRLMFDHDLCTFCLSLQNAGAGEIVINCIDNDGKMLGYDVDLVLELKKYLTIPITLLGGAGSIDHLSDLVSKAGLIGVAASSLFVFKGKYRAVLINYPNIESKKKICNNLYIQKG